MHQTRTALVRRLQALEDGLDRRIEQNLDTADPWPEFEDKAAAIRQAAAAKDREYVGLRIHGILARHGLAPATGAHHQSPSLPRNAPQPRTGARL